MAKRLKLLDSGWLMMETPETPMHVGGLMLFQLPENAPDDYLQSFFQYLLQVDDVSAPFSQKLQRLLPFNMDASWVKDGNFDIEYHVRPSALPKPGRIRELLALVSRLHAQRMDHHRPMWECYLIEGIEGNRFAIYTKIHHSLVDGVAATRLMQSRMARSPEEDLPPVWSAEWTKRLPKKEKRSLPLPPSPKEALRSFSNGAAQLIDLLKTPRDGNAKALFQAPKTILNHRVTGARRFAAQSWSMDRIRTVAKGYHATVNDIVLAMCGGSLRDYLKSYDALPATPLVAQVPVSVRAADADDDNGNAISAVQVTLGTDIGHPVDRLRAIQESMKAAKHRLSSMEKADINAFTVLSNLPLMLGQATGLAGRRSTMFNVVISNVPGPKEPLYMYGAKMLANYPVSLIWHGYAANITVHSYVDSLDFGIIACRDTVPRVQRMLDYLEDALVALESHLPQKD